MAIVLIILSILIFFGSLVSFLFKRFRWKGAWVTLGSFILFFVASFIGAGEMDTEARHC